VGNLLLNLWLIQCLHRHKNFSRHFLESLQILTNFPILSKLDTCLVVDIFLVSSTVENQIPVNFKSQVLLSYLLTNSSDSFTNFETTNFFGETEFVYLFLCTVNVNNNIQIRRFIVSTNSWNYVMSSLLHDNAMHSRSRAGGRRLICLTYFSVMVSYHSFFFCNYFFCPSVFSPETERTGGKNWGNYSLTSDVYRKKFKWW